MNVYVNSIDGIASAIDTMFMSKRTWTREMELKIIDICDEVNDRHGRMQPYDPTDPEQTQVFNQYTDWMNRLLKWGVDHITMLRYIDFWISVEGLHRGGQDDWDAHAYRFNNRIIRSSTRMADFTYEMSDFYKDKIIPTDAALAILGLSVPDKIEKDGVTYVKAVNGYIREDMKDSNDAKRGLYMMSIPSNFTFRINLTEWAHVYKEGNANGHANPEVKECCEAIADQLEDFQPKFKRELFLNIKN